MWVAVAIGGAALGAGAQIYSANKAADAQTHAADTATAAAQQAFNTTNTNLAPYRDIGNTAAGQLTSKLSDLTTPISVNPQDFLNSDQYKFQQTQGERAVTNSSAARGLGTSGAALKGAAAFESGLNSQQWQQNFNNQNTNQTNAFNRLSTLVNTGENAAAGTGNAASTAAGQIGSAAGYAGNAQAGAATASGNAIANAAGNIGGYAAYKGLYSPSSGGAFGSPTTMNNGLTNPMNIPGYVSA